jgi:hypothetical protein
MSSVRGQNGCHRIRARRAAVNARTRRADTLLTALEK